MHRQPPQRSPVPELSRAAHGRALQLQRRLSCLALLLCSACDVTIADGLSEAEARALGATLNREGIAVSTERQGYGAPRYQLAITPAAVPRAVSALRAAAPVAAPEREPSLALIPTLAAERSARELELQKRVAQVLEQLPGVRRAAVQVSLGTSAAGLSDLLQPDRGTAASVDVSLVRDAEARLDQARVRERIASLIPGLATSAIRLDDQTETASCPPCAELSHLGEVTITRTSLDTLKLWLGASLLAHMASALALLVLLQRRRARDGGSDRRPR